MWGCFNSGNAVECGELVKWNSQKRKHPRLKEYDYSSPGAYFITICVKSRKQMLGKIVGCGDFDAPQMELSEYGQNIWRRSFHDHIIRDKYDYEKIWEYIDNVE